MSLVSVSKEGSTFINPAGIYSGCTWVGGQKSQELDAALRAGDRQASGGQRGSGGHGHLKDLSSQESGPSLPSKKK